MFTILKIASSVFSFFTAILGWLTNLAVFKAGQRSQQVADLKETNHEDVEARKIEDSNAALTGTELDDKLRKSFSDP